MIEVMLEVVPLILEPIESFIILRVVLGIDTLSLLLCFILGIAASLLDIE